MFKYLQSILRATNPRSIQDFNFAAAEARVWYATPNQGATSGPPTAGTWALDELYWDSDRKVWRCSVAGTPGTWVPYIPGSVTSGANPSASIGLSPINGTALTFLRSDGAPALSQAIAPFWTGQHFFSARARFQSFDASYPNTASGPFFNFGNTPGSPGPGSFALGFTSGMVHGDCVHIMLAGEFANNANSKRCVIWLGPASPFGSPYPLFDTGSDAFVGKYFVDIHFNRYGDALTSVAVFHGAVTPASFDIIQMSNAVIWPWTTPTDSVIRGNTNGVSSGDAEFRFGRIDFARNPA
jgi:hypothetical protein